MLYPTWLNPGDNAWQMTAATLVGLMSVPGLVVLYGGVMQKRWSVNSMMLAFIAFALVLVMWVLYGYNMGFGHPIHFGGSDSGFFNNLLGKPGAVLSAHDLQGQGEIPLIGKVRLPAVVPRLLPARVRSDHADPHARLGARSRELQGVDPVRRALVDVRVHGQRLPDLGRRLVRTAGRSGLLGWLRHPPRGGRLGLRRGMR